MRQYSRTVARAGLIAAMYAALTLLARPFSFGYGGVFQMRIAEALTVLPVLTPAAVPGLAVGCFVANLLGGGTALDVVAGSAATLLAAVCTRLLRKNAFLASLMPTVFNSVIVGFVLCAASKGLPYPAAVLSIAPGEFLSATGLGLGLLRLARRIPVWEDRT